MQVVEILRRWQAGGSTRTIAQAMGLARNTVGKYLREAGRLGVSRAGPAPTNEQIVALSRLSQTAPPARATPRASLLEPHQEQIAHWLQDEELQLTRVAELLGRQGVPVSYMTLHRFVRSQGLKATTRDTVRMPDVAPGEVAEFDFGTLGRLLDPTTGKRQLIWAMNLVLVFSRHQFVWPLLRQTLEEVIAGLDATWWFFQGIPRRVIFDNFPAAVAGADALNPVLTRGFLEYCQARGFIADPARVRHPKDKPHTERNVQYVRERFWKGGSFTDLADVRAQAKQWCLEVAGQRIHGTTRKVPLVVFQDQERAHLLPYDGLPYSIPLRGQVTVHPDHHIAFRYAIYSVPSDRCLPGTRLEVRADRDLVHIYHRGELVKIHPRKPRGGRSTDAADYPPERTIYTMRMPEYVIREAARLGPGVGQFAQRLLAGDFPWAKLRQGQQLLRLGERYSAPRLGAACERALSVDLIDVRRVERMLKEALEQEALPEAPTPPPSARFARAGSSFDHRYPTPPEVMP